MRITFSVITCVLCGSIQAAEGLPNIMLLLADDLGDVELFEESEINSVEFM